MKKDDMIKYLVEDGDFTKKELKKMEVADIEELFNERFSVEEDEDFSKGLEFGEDYVDDPTIERELLEKHGINAEVFMESDLEKEIEIAKEEEVVDIDISKLSKYEQRHYRRTGGLPKLTINRYTRFDDENPKMDN